MRRVNLWEQGEFPWQFPTGAVALEFDQYTNSRLWRGTGRAPTPHSEQFISLLSSRGKAEILKSQWKPEMLRRGTNCLCRLWPGRACRAAGRSRL